MLILDIKNLILLVKMLILDINNLIVTSDNVRFWYQ